MPETVNHIDGRTAVSDIILHWNGNYRSFISFFIIYLTVKSFLTDFESPPPPPPDLSPVLMQNESLIGVI